MDINLVGAFCFGIVTGYITYRTLVRTIDKAAVSDLAAVFGVVGGGVVTKLFSPNTDLFGWYAIGLLLGMALFFLLFWRMNSKEELGDVMGGKTLHSAVRTSRSQHPTDDGRPRP